MNSVEKTEVALDKVRVQHKRLKREKFTGEVVFTIKLTYNQGGVRTEEVTLKQKV